MDLKARLARLDRLTRRPEPQIVPGDPAARPADVAGTGAAWHAASLTGPLGLMAETTPAGTLWAREDRTEAPAPPVAVPETAGVLPAGTPPGLGPEDILFLDLETTGLAGGTGSLAFLVGLAWWEGAAFVVRQLFLPGPGREAPLLWDLDRVTARFRVVATYNGASFDLPLLRTRALLARRDDPCAALVGWDLLTGVRRLWGPRLPDCRQQTAEARICGLDRGPGDIDGGLIPQAYFRYLQAGELDLLPRVLRHNRRDMRGMAHILVRLLAVAGELEPAPPPEALWPGPWQDAWARGRACERRRRPWAAAGWLGRAVDEAGVGILPPGHLGDLPLVFCLDAVRILKRARDWRRVAAVLDTALALHPRERRLHREAAILYEYRLPDRGRALAHAEVLGEVRRLERLRRRRHQDGNAG